MTEEVLHRYQRRLLELLRRGEPPAAIRAALLADMRLAPLRSYIRGLDLHALVVATELVAKWSVPPSDEPGDGGPRYSGESSNG